MLTIYVTQHLCADFHSDPSWLLHLGGRWRQSPIKHNVQQQEIARCILWCCFLHARLGLSLNIHTEADWSLNIHGLIESSGKNINNQVGTCTEGGEKSPWCRPVKIKQWITEDLPTFPLLLLYCDFFDTYVPTYLSAYILTLVLQ